MFLTDHEIRRLTDRATKAGQAGQLRKMGIPFYVNASGWPVVVRSAVEGGNVAASKAESAGWAPAVVQRKCA